MTTPWPAPKSRNWANEELHRFVRRVRSTHISLANPDITGSQQEGTIAADMIDGIDNMDGRYDG